jgi:Flp pilus assembly protein TadG
MLWCNTMQKRPVSTTTGSSGKLRTIASRIRGQRGQSLTEFALLAPVLVVLTLGVADMGRAFYYKEAVTNTARQAIRLAALTQNQSVGDFACLPANGWAGNVPARSMPDSTGDVITTLINQAATETSSDGTTGTSVLSNTSGNASLDTKIKLDWNCKSGAAVTNANATSQDPTNPNSDSIRAQIDYSFQLFTPLIGNLVSGRTVHIRSDVRGRSEY